MSSRASFPLAESFLRAAARREREKEEEEKRRKAEEEKGEMKRALEEMFEKQIRDITAGIAMQMSWIEASVDNLRSGLFMDADSGATKEKQAASASCPASCTKPFTTSGISYGIMGTGAPKEQRKTKSTAKQQLAGVDAVTQTDEVFICDDDFLRLIVAEAREEALAEARRTMDELMDQKISCLLGSSSSRG